MKCPAVSDKLLADVIRLVAGGGLVPEIKAWLTKNHPNVSHEEVFSKTNEHFRVVASGDENELIGFCIEATKTLFRDMKDDSDYPGALKAVVFLDKLSGKMKDAEIKGEIKRESLVKLLKAGNDAN